jgi:mxaA protein
MHKICLLFCLLMFSSANNFAYEDPRKFPDMDPKYVDISILDPNQKVGYTVGDYINREITLTVKEPFKLIEESLPIVGYEKRYRGQLLGISLKAINVSKKTKDDLTTFVIKLKYQIFTNNVVAKPASITADYYRFINPNEPKKIQKFRVPAFTFAISPIAIFGDVKIENDMSPYRGPFLKDKIPEENKIKFSLFALIIILLTFIYIYGRYTWLPNRTFSMVYRRFKKQKPSAANTKKIITALHAGFDNLIEQSLFEDNIALLIKKNGSFKHIEKELHTFFKISRALFFQKDIKLDQDELNKWLINFSLHCRMCERKLIVNPKDIKGISF